MSSKRRIRWDRITVAAVVLVILIFLLGSCMQRCPDKGNDDDLITAQQDSIPTEEQLETDDTASAGTSTLARPGSTSTVRGVTTRLCRMRLKT